MSGVETGDSEHLAAVTDVDQPSDPSISNLTCYDGGGGAGNAVAALYVQWQRPGMTFTNVTLYLLLALLNLLSRNYLLDDQTETLNVACFNLDICVNLVPSDIYYRSVDYYKIYYKTVGDLMYSNMIVQAADDAVQKVSMEEILRNYLTYIRQLLYMIFTSFALSLD